MVGLIGRAAGIARWTAAAASTSPDPYFSLGTGSVGESRKGRAVSRRMAITSWAGSAGLTERTSAAAPATWGLAIDVPLIVA